MALTHFSGFEAGEATRTGAGATFDATIKRSGARSLKIAAASNVITYGDLSSFFGSTVTGFLRFYVRITALPSSASRLLFGSNETAILLGSNGKLVFRTGATTFPDTATALTDTTRWYQIGVPLGAVTSGTLLQIDGVTETTGTKAAQAVAAYWFGDGEGFNTETYTAYFDDVAIDGSAFPNAGSVVLLSPTSDNGSSAASWTKPGGSTTNRNTSVDNVPPVGVADSTNVAQAENQIRNATANASYVANMTTYTAAGIGASDTVNAIRSFVSVGAPVSTGAKTGSQQITANPAAGAATAFAANSGQFWTGSAASTFPSGWKWERGPVSSAPSVTLGNAPTLSLNITGGTASRIADCCFMGIYVDYTPAAVAAAAVPYTRPYPPLLAQ